MKALQSTKIKSTASSVHHKVSQNKKVQSTASSVHHKADSGTQKNKK